jgi:hypothetical protein
MKEDGGIICPMAKDSKSILMGNLTKEIMKMELKKGKGN